MTSNRWPPRTGRDWPEARQSRHPFNDWSTPTTEARPTHYPTQSPPPNDGDTFGMLQRLWEMKATNTTEIQHLWKAMEAIADENDAIRKTQAEHSQILQRQQWLKDLIVNHGMQLVRAIAGCVSFAIALLLALHMIQPEAAMQLRKPIDLVGQALDAP